MQDAWYVLQGLTASRLFIGDKLLLELFYLFSFSVNWIWFFTGQKKLNLLHKLIEKTIISLALGTLP